MGLAQAWSRAQRVAPPGNAMQVRSEVWQVRRSRARESSKREDVESQS